MLNNDFTYCEGYTCPIAKKCKRFNKEAIDSTYPLHWTKAYYDEVNDSCPLFLKKDIEEKTVHNCYGDFTKEEWDRFCENLTSYYENSKFTGD